MPHVGLMTNNNNSLVPLGRESGGTGTKAFVQELDEFPPPVETIGRAVIRIKKTSEKYLYTK